MTPARSYSCSLSLRERVGVRGSWLRSRAPDALQAHAHAPASTVLAHSLTPTLSRREREQKATRISPQGLTP